MIMNQILLLFILYVVCTAVAPTTISTLLRRYMKPILEHNSELTHGELSASADCVGEFKPSFSRISGLIEKKTKYSIKIPLPKCLELCRLNQNPLNSSHLACKGLNVMSGRVPRCMLFEVESNEQSNREEREWNDVDFSYHYEKICVRIPPNCESLAYMFSVRRNFRLLNPKEELSNATSISQCRQLCIDISCKAFEFQKSTGNCAIYNGNETNADAKGVRALGVDFYENVCEMASARRCDGKRVDFIMVRHSDVAAFGVPSDARSVRDCMKDCVSSSFFGCRSLQFDPLKNSCFISDESSDSAVPSSHLDLFEPICLPSAQIFNSEASCNRPYIYEKIMTSRLQHTIEIAILSNIAIDPCLSACLIDSRCRSVNYNVRLQNCHLLPVFRSGQNIKIDENFDYYELACETSRTDYSKDTNAVLIANERTLLPEFRHLQHVHITSWNECKDACEAAVFGCRTFSFSASLSECHLSSEYLQNPDDSRTQGNADFDIFALKTNTNESALLLPIQSHQLTAPENFMTNSTSPTLVSTKTTGFTLNSHSVHYPTLIQQTENITSIEATTISSESDESAETSFNLNILKENIFALSTTVEPAHEQRMLDQGTTLHPQAAYEKENSVLAFSTDIQIIENNNSLQKQSTDTMQNTTREVMNSDLVQNNNVLSKQALQGFELKDLAPSVKDPESSEFESNAIPRMIPLTENVGHVSPDSVFVTAECYDKGVNVSFNIQDSIEGYTGAVYAAERFSQCRVFVKHSNDFAIFIPRPAHNTWCNALETNGILSAVIVMSNDRVLPHDVTTKDDLFYQVTCNYTHMKVNKIKTGLVVGGPSPTLIRSRPTRSFSLQIMQNNHPVDSVYIGEPLTARVKSDIPDNRLHVTECTATRVGGQVTPTTVQLIAEGCALMPSIMGPMRLSKHGWEASLNAFRIDGSEQIDIVCLVVVCHEKACPQTNHTCLSNGRSSRSLTDDSTGEPVRVDSRLVVLGGDRQARDEELDQYVFPELCLQPLIYFPVMCITLFCLISLACSCCFANRRQPKMKRLFTPSSLSGTRYEHQS